MKLWKFFLYISACLLIAATGTGIYTALFGGVVTFWFTAVFIVMGAHSMIYAFWQLLKHPGKLAVFRKD